MAYPVIKGARYLLVHVPNMLINNGTTHICRKKENPDSSYLKNIYKHI